MKLRTRVIIISCLAVLVSSVICNIAVCVVCYRQFYNEAFETACSSTSMSFEKILQAVETYGKSGSSAEDMKICLNYFIKQTKDEYIICYYDDEEVYNHTVITRKTLQSLEYDTYFNFIGNTADSINNDKLYCSLLKWQGQNFFAFSINHGKDKPELYRLVDIGYVNRNMVRIVETAAAVTVFVLMAVGICLYFILKRAFAPMQELSQIAGEMADNEYGHRVPVYRSDEVGRLAKNFNRMAEAVETHMHRIELSEKKKTLFMGNLTHELKTPMTAISGYAQLLLTAKISEEDREEALYYIYAECNRLERLSKKMMELLELEQEEKIILEETPAKTLFEAAKRSCSVILEKKGITLSCVEHGERFMMDIDLMTDVMVNLIDNAVKASKAGGHIEVGCEDSCIWVRDFGIGIPKAEQDKIMEPFYMVDKSRSRKSGGAGLGLALTAVIARLHHIEIHLESEPDKGTCFILQFV